MVAEKPCFKLFDAYLKLQRLAPRNTMLPYFFYASVIGVYFGKCLGTSGVFVPPLIHKRNPSLCIRCECDLRQTLQRCMQMFYLIFKFLLCFFSGFDFRLQCFLCFIQCQGLLV